jgi:hypothetical protein
MCLEIFAVPDAIPVSVFWIFSVHGNVIEDQSYYEQDDNTSEDRTDYIEVSQAFYFW